MCSFSLSLLRFKVNNFYTFKPYCLRGSLHMIFLNIKVMTYTLNHRSYMNYTYKKKTLPKKALFSGFHFYKKSKKLFSNHLHNWVSNISTRELNVQQRRNCGCNIGHIIIFIALPIFNSPTHKN